MKRMLCGLGMVKPILRKSDGNEKLEGKGPCLLDVANELLRNYATG